MTIDVFDQSGKKIDQVELLSAIFQAPINPSLVAQAIRVRLINARTGTAHTKTRAEVSGGGRKPWRQKGTGRARHGSTRSPIWVGGGVAFGPRTSKPHATMPTSMRRAALFSALSDKAQQGKVVVISDLGLKQSKTQLVNKVLSALPIDRTALIVVPTKDDVLIKATRNLDHIKVMVAPVLHPYEIMKYKTLVLTQASLPVLEETFIKGQAPIAEQKVDSKSATKSVAKKAVAAKPATKKPAAVKATKAKSEK